MNTLSNCVNFYRKSRFSSICDAWNNRTESYLGNAMVYWTMKPTCIIYAANSWEFVNCWQNTGDFSYEFGVDYST